MQDGLPSGDQQAPLNRNTPWSRLGLTVLQWKWLLYNLTLPMILLVLDVMFKFLNYHRFCLWTLDSSIIYFSSASMIIMLSEDVARKNISSDISNAQIVCSHLLFILIALFGFSYFLKTDYHSFLLLEYANSHPGSLAILPATSLISTSSISYLLLAEQTLTCISYGCLGLSVWLSCFLLKRLRLAI
jgi:hypothetical protein